MEHQDLPGLHRNGRDPIGLGHVEEMEMNHGFKELCRRGSVVASEPLNCQNGTCLVYFQASNWHMSDSHVRRGVGTIRQALRARLCQGF